MRRLATAWTRIKGFARRPPVSAGRAEGTSGVRLVPSIPPNAARRAMAKWDRLRPSSLDPVVFEAWVRLHVPDATDHELDEWREVMTEILAKPLPVPQLVAPEPVEVVVPAPIFDRDAAERFVEWVRMCGRTGVYSTSELSDLLREHWDCEGLDPRPVTSIMIELENLSGVSRKFNAPKPRKGHKLNPRVVDWVALFSSERGRKPSGSEVMEAFPGMKKSTAYDYAGRGSKIYATSIWSIASLDEDTGDAPWMDLPLLKAA